MNNELIALTLYDSHKTVLLRPSEIVAIVPMEAFQSGKVEGGQRTRIDYQQDGMVLVTESPEQIMKLLGIEKTLDTSNPEA